MPRRQFLSAGSVSQESHPWQSPVVLLAEAAAAAGLRAAHTRVVWTMSILEKKQKNKDIQKLKIDLAGCGGACL